MRIAVEDVAFADQFIYRDIWSHLLSYPPACSREPPIPLLGPGSQSVHFEDVSRKGTTMREGCANMKAESFHKHVIEYGRTTDYYLY